MKGKLFIISAPSGAGKSTLINKLVSEKSDCIRSISYTTRPMRKTERDGVDYFFITRNVFEKKIQTDDFLEFAKVFNHYYGTDKQWVESRQNEGKHVFLVIDTQGAMLLKKKYIDAIYIFILPPNTQALKKRLEKRASDSEKSMEERLSWSQKEISLAKNYDYQIVNDNFDLAYNTLKAIIDSEIKNQSK